MSAQRTFFPYRENVRNFFSELHTRTLKAKPPRKYRLDRFLLLLWRTIKGGTVTPAVVTGICYKTMLTSFYTRMFKEGQRWNTSWESDELYVSEFRYQDFSRTDFEKTRRNIFLSVKDPSHFYFSTTSRTDPAFYFGTFPVEEHKKIFTRCRTPSTRKEEEESESYFQTLTL